MLVAHITFHSGSEIPQPYHPALITTATTTNTTSFIPSFIHSIIHSSKALQLFGGPWFLFQSRNPSYTDGRTPSTSDQPVARPLPTHRTT
jgi:hypothetical protein